MVESTWAQPLTMQSTRTDNKSFTKGLSRSWSLRLFDFFIMTYYIFEWIIRYIYVKSDILVLL